ncbi:hypothetical protein D3C87_1696280 [compost metagenome]
MAQAKRLKLILIILLDIEHFQRAPLHLIGVVSIKKRCVQGTLINGELVIYAAPKLLNSLVVFIRLLQQFSFVQFFSEPLQTFLLLIVEACKFS